MDRKIVPLSVIESTDEHVIEILDAARLSDFRHVVVIGIWEDGGMDVSHTTMTEQDLNWHLDKAKQLVLSDEEE